MNFGAFVFVGVLLALAGCSSAPRSAAPASANTQSRATDAALTPLNDFNLAQAEIPVALLAAQKAPYYTPTPLVCEVLIFEVEALDDVLGPDLDTPPNPQRPSLIERGSSAVGRAAVNALRSTAESVVPFRSWVRRLTGAERYAREVAAAIAAGTARRAFLKGLGQARGCSPPAAPLPAPEEP